MDQSSSMPGQVILENEDEHLLSSSLVVAQEAR